MIVERRDQVRSTFFSLRAFMASISGLMLDASRIENFASDDVRRLVTIAHRRILRAIEQQDAEAVLRAGVAAALSARAVQAQQIRLMTGPQGGVWVPLGGAFKDMWEKALPGVTVQSLPGAGIANVRGIEEGKAEIGFGNSITTVDAVKGERRVVFGAQAARQQV